MQSAKQDEAQIKNGARHTCLYVSEHFLRSNNVLRRNLRFIRKDAELRWFHPAPAQSTQWQLARHIRLLGVLSNFVH